MYGNHSYKQGANLIKLLINEVALHSDPPLADLNVRAGRLRQLAENYLNCKVYMKESNYVTSFYMNIMNTYENDILIIDDLGLPIEIQKLLITLDKLDYTNYLVHCHDQDDKCSLDIFFYKNI